MNFQNLVKEFMLTAGQQFPIENKEELSKVLEERKGYLLEEIKELETAIENNDRVEQLDAICDILYIHLGTCNVLDDRYYFYLSDYDSPLESELKDSFLLFYKYVDIKDSSICSLAFEVAFHLQIPLEVIQEAFKRVHESNMSKFCKTEKEADQTQSHYYYSLDTKTYIEENNGYYVVKRASDNKVLKSVNYKRVDLTDLV